MAARDTRKADARRESDRRWLEAQVASDRYLDPPTGLPRLPTLCQALAARAGGPPVVIALVAIDGYEDLVRRRGHSVGERCRLQLGAALRSLVTEGRADVAAGGAGRFVVVGPDTADHPGGALVSEIRNLARPVGAGLGDPAPTVGISVGHAPSAARAAHALRGEIDSAELTRARVAPSCEPIVATRSGRLRGVHVRPSPDRTPQDGAWGVDLVAATARAVRGWPVRLARAVDTVWIDVPGSAVAGSRLDEIVRDGWVDVADAPRLGLRVHPDTVAELEDVPALRALAGRGVRFALAGLSTGLPDPGIVDRRVFREIVIDAALVAGAVRDPHDAALAWGLVALAERHGLLTTADGVDDDATFQVASGLGVWRVQGAAFGPVRPLATALAGWEPGSDLRSTGLPGADDDPARPRLDTTAPRLAGDGAGVWRELTRWAVAVDEVAAEARPRVRGWVGEATTPAHVRRLLAAECRSRRWTLAEASLLVALATG